jgi:hypothetical protein
LLFFASLFLCGCYVYRRFAERRIQDNTLGLIAFSIPMLAAALGRSDPGHVLLNGLGIFLATSFYLSNYPSLWKWYRAAFVVILIVIPGLACLWFYRPWIMRCGVNTLSESGEDSLLRRSLTKLGHIYIVDFASPAKRAKFENALSHAEHAPVSQAVDLATVYPSWHGAFLAPFGYKPNGIGTYLSKQVEYGRFEGFENANTVDAIHQKLEEIRHDPERALLLPDHFESFCQVDVPAERRQVTILFAFPYLGKAVHPESVRKPICEHILDNYKVEKAASLQTFGYGLWVAKTGTIEDPK